MFKVMPYERQLKERQVYKTLPIRGLSKKFVEFVNKNKTTIPIAFKFVYN